MAHRNAQPFAAKSSPAPRLAVVAGLVAIAVVLALMLKDLGLLLPQSRAGQLIYVSDTDGNLELYLVSGNGGDGVRLTNHPAADWDPVWSPDGRQIAFVSNRDGDHEIYVMNPAGAERVRLTSHPAADWNPTWAPDGKKIAFLTARHGNIEIYTTSPDGSNLTRLTSLPDRNNRYPAWAPDSRRLAFASERRISGFLEDDIYVINADGSGLKSLTSFAPGRSAMFPVWSPSGQHIAFVSARILYVMDSSGGRLTPLFTPPQSWMDIYDLAWRPRKFDIAFVSQQEGDNWQVHIWSSDLRHERSHTAPLPGARYPTWSRDGQRISYLARRGNHWEVSVVNADGSGLRTVARAGAASTVGGPRWRP